MRALASLGGDRFVARLFADFTVLFVGYSLNDPVLRYMTDAFAADEAAARNGRSRGPAYIFMPFSGKQTPDAAPYRNRRLEPIFYNQIKGHSRLRKTLVAWADAREDYLSNTRQIIERDALSRPETLDPSATNNVLWAVVGRPRDAGYGANIFASLERPPPIEWLYEFEKRETEIRQE